jgi:steroid 5-alpha reductase family enzyme
MARINPFDGAKRYRGMTFILCAPGLFFAMSFAWLVRLRTGQSGWIDAIWAAATGAAAIVFAEPRGGRSLFAAALVALWALRLAVHIGWRTRGAGDDPRYAALAREWGVDFPRRLFLFLQIQAAAALPLVAAVGLAARAPRPFPDFFDAFGLLIALSGLAVEAVADAQLRRFRNNAPRGALCESGLWRISRHPNYFGEFLFWCAWPVIGFGGWRGMAALAAPVFVYLLLDRVSGVPPLEKHLRASRGAAFDDYAARVPRFFPGWR